MYNIPMTTEQSALLKLISQSQFGIPADIDWDTIDTDALYKEASLQAVLGLIAPLIPEDHADDKWKTATLQQESNYIRYCFTQDELKNILDSNDIPFVILKGNAAAIGYKEPMRRAMGDIDFLVPQDKFEQARQALNNNGYTEDHDGERHLVFKKGGKSFELHRRFSHEIDIEDYVIGGMNNAVQADIDGHEFPMLPMLPNGLVLLDHMRNHLRSGLGLRQVIDWMMYVHRNLDDAFWNSEFGPIAHDKGLDTLAITATRMCEIYLELPSTHTWCSKADEDTCRQLLEILFISGNFGRKNGRGSAVESVSTRIKQNGLFPWLQYTGEKNWEAYHKHHWLKPFCWCYQICRYAKKGFQSGRNAKQLRNDLNRSDNRYDLLKKLNID